MFALRTDHFELSFWKKGFIATGIFYNRRYGRIETKRRRKRKTLFFVPPVLLLPVTFEGISSRSFLFRIPSVFLPPYVRIYTVRCFAMFDLMLSLIDGTRWIYTADSAVAFDSTSVAMPTVKFLVTLDRIKSLLPPSRCIFSHEGHVVFREPAGSNSLTGAYQLT